MEAIVTGSTETALAAKQATSTIPIGTGLVASLARPGGNVTGLSFLGTELAGKHMELLAETVPGLSRVTVLSNPANASHAPRLREVEGAARKLGVQLEVVKVRDSADIELSFATMSRQGVGALLVLSDSLFGREAGRLAALASKNGLPTMFGLREHVLAGGLLSYGASFRDLFCRAASYVDKLLKGAKPADLPVE